MKLVWMKSKAPFSVLIRLITKDDCSHFAFVFQSAAKGLMFEANLLGTHPAFYQTALKTHTLMHELDVPLSAEQEDRIWDLVIEKYDGRSYDYRAILYLGIRKLLVRFSPKLFPLPTKNAWLRSGAFFCDEIYDVLNQVPGFKQIDVISGMDTPHDVWAKVKS